MNRKQAQIEANRRWGSLGKVVRASWFDHFTGKREKEYRVGEVTDRGFQVYGASPDSWDEAFKKAAAGGQL
jgi:hypothetical protein